MKPSKVTRTFEGYGRLGKDWHSGSPFFGEAPSTSEFGWLIVEALGERKVKKIHDLTCGIKKLETRSITGDYYLTEKCIKYKIDISVKAELVDDEEEEAR